MTLIAFATYGNRAEFITDTVRYTAGAEVLGRVTKFVAAPHIDAAFLTQGDSDFGDQAKVALLMASGGLSFDELSDHAGEWMRDLWRPHLIANLDISSAIVFLIGFSGREERFVAYAYGSDQDFERSEHESFVIPAPFTTRVSDIEMARFRDHLAEHPEVSQENVESMCRVWSERAPFAPPASVGDWKTLAETVREQRSLDRFFSTIVAGDVFHTVIGRGSVQTNRIHRFNDEGEELLRLVAGSRHPLSLAAPCFDCESGRPFGECCGSHDRQVTL